MAERPPASRANVVEGPPWPRGREGPADCVDPEAVDLANQPGRAPALRKEGPTWPQGEPAKP
eukprot:11532739-Alexandrium_andersonii.AAC.1